MKFIDELIKFNAKSANHVKSAQACVMQHLHHALNNPATHDLFLDQTPKRIYSDDAQTKLNNQFLKEHYELVSLQNQGALSNLGDIAQFFQVQYIILFDQYNIKPPYQQPRESESDLLYKLGKEQENISSSKTLEYYAQAAEQGHAGALLRLGEIYTYGVHGVGCDFNKAITFYSQAADSGDHGISGSALFHIGAIYEHQLKHINTASTCIYFYAQAAKIGSMLAYERLGNIYYPNSSDFLNIKKDLKKSLHYYTRAAETDQGGLSFYQLGIKYAEINNFTEAAHCYEKSLEKGFASALLNLGEIYLLGKGDVEPDINKAWDYFNRAYAGEGTDNTRRLLNTHLALKLGHICRDAEPPIGQDYGKAAKYFRSAGKDGKHDLFNLYSQHPENPEVIYHATFIASSIPGYLKNEGHKLFDAFNNLAKNQPEIFDQLAGDDIWEKVKLLIIPELAEAVHQRIAIHKEKQESLLNENILKISFLNDIVSDYVTDNSYRMSHVKSILWNKSTIDSAEADMQDEKHLESPRRPN